MNRKLLKILQQYFFAVLFIIFSFLFTASAQSDPNPNSPLPVILGADDSTRAPAVKESGKTLERKTSDRAK